MGQLRRPADLMTLAFVVPGRLDQLTGGYLYDRHIVEGLRDMGRVVDVIALPGSYPDADAATRSAAAEALANVPDGNTVIIDGLALPGFEDCLQAQARRLHLIGLIHHPLSLETGLDAVGARRYAALEAKLWPQLKGAICPSEHTARAVLASGLPADRVAVVAPGTHRPAAIRRTASAEGPLQWLAVGSITPRKGHLLLVEALAALNHGLHRDLHHGLSDDGLPHGLQHGLHHGLDRGLHHDPRQDHGNLDWRLTCIGSLERDPAAVSALRARIATHHLEDRIALLGEQPAERLAEAYQSAHLFVLPSYHEGYGMVFAEALAHGLPVIATTAGAIPDTVPAAASLLVPPGDVPALRNALWQALTDTALRARLTAAAVQAAHTLPDWGSAVRNWATALDKVNR
jgi:glycosyltransferase involved in cell wall biosynthesis